MDENQTDGLVFNGPVPLMSFAGEVGERYCEIGVVVDEALGEVGKS